MTASWLHCECDKAFVLTARRTDLSTGWKLFVLVVLFSVISILM